MLTVRYQPNRDYRSNETEVAPVGWTVGPRELVMQRV
jgi:hypothetical protein